MRQKKRRILAAFWFVATTCVWGSLISCGATGNWATLGDEPASTAKRSARPIAVESRTEKLESPSGRKAFLVGADDYADALDLRFVKNDVEAFAARLVEIGFDEKNIVVLKTGGDFSSFPTKANIESRFTAFYRNLRPGDFVVVYLSGHGLRSAESGESFFAPIDVKPLDPFKTSVSIDKILAALARSKANFRWTIVDACRNDPTGSTSGSASAIFKTRSSGAAKALTEITDAPTSVALLQSCQPGRVSFEGDGDLKNGLFTLGLLEALDPKGTKADVDRNGALTFTEVLKYVSERTNELAGECYGESQIPCWSGSFTDFAILTDLRKDGLSREDWERAEAFYREAAALRRERRYREAAEKLDLATAINKNNAEYAAARAELAELLEAQTALQEARQAAETAAREASAAEAAAREANAAEKAEAERKAREASDAKRRAEEAARRAATNDASERAAPEKNTSLGWNDKKLKAGDRKTLIIKEVEFVFRFCPPGDFEMGSPKNEIGRFEDEKIRRIVFEKGFWILENEVTQRQWTAIMGENPSWFSNVGPGKRTVDGLDTTNFPVERVSWGDCREFVKRLNWNTGFYSVIGMGIKECRLPTEAEWEYACRAGTTGMFADINIDLLAWYDGNSGQRTRDVKTKEPNAWGIYDMHGNVYEWCCDCYRSYSDKALTEPVVESLGNNRVTRGGCWRRSATFGRSACRYSRQPNARINYLGFRPVLTIQ